MSSKYDSGSSTLRLIAAVVSVTVAVLFILVLSYLFSDPASVAGEIMLDRHTTAFPYPFTIQNAMWVMFFVGCGELWVRFHLCSLERAELERRYLPEDDSIMLRAQDLGPIYQQVKPAAGHSQRYLPRLISRCITQFQSSRSIDQSNTLLNSSLELFQHELDLAYNMVRYIVWFIPTLGFIGTVVGIALALNFAATFPDPQDPGLLAGISKSLGVAFYTTLVALVQAAILVFAMHITQEREETVLNHSGQYCLDNLINKLYEK